MSKILCAKSGILFNTDHFSFGLNSREYEHPVFKLHINKLLKLYNSYLAGTLTPTEDYLLFLSILDSTELVEWRVPAKYTEKTPGIIANNIGQLVHVVTHLNVIANPSIEFARIAITPDTKNLDNIKYWLAGWVNNYNEFINNNRYQQLRQTIMQLELKLEQQIKTPQKNETKFAAILAEWAAKAGSFPEYIISYKGSTMPCSTYWKLIIRKAANSENLLEIDSIDVQDLVEHCEEHIEKGTIFSHALFNHLNNAVKKINNKYGFYSNSIPNYTILNANTSVEDANKLAIISGAPDIEPIQSNYPTKFSYTKAKLAWDMAQNYKKESSNANISKGDLNI